MHFLPCYLSVTIRSLQRTSSLHFVFFFFFIAFFTLMRMTTTSTKTKSCWFLSASKGPMKDTFISTWRLREKVKRRRGHVPAPARVSTVHNPDEGANRIVFGNHTPTHVSISDDNKPRLEQTYCPTFPVGTNTRTSRTAKRFLVKTNTRRKF